MRRYLPLIWYNIGMGIGASMVYHHWSLGTVLWVCVIAATVLSITNHFARN